MQLISQLKEVYGDKKADIMSGNCKTRAVFSSPDSTTSKWASESLGKKEVEEVKEGLTFGANEIRDGVSLSRNIKVEELVMPSEIQMLPNLSFYLRLPFHFPISKVQIKPKERIKLSESLIEREDIIEELFEETPSLDEPIIVKEKKKFIRKKRFVEE